MKVLPSVLIGLGVITGLIYVASPYVAVASLANNVEQKDAEAISAAIDYEALRQNIKDQINAEMMTSFADKIPEGGGLEMMGAMMAGAIVDKMVDAMITPEGMNRAMGAALGTQKGESQLEYETRYLSHDRFDVVVTQDFGGKEMESPVVASFERRGFLEWKLVGIDFPFEEMRKAEQASAQPF